MSSSKLLVGVLVGVAAGAALGIIMAPEKGSETRKKISKKGENYLDQIKVQFDSLLDNIASNYKKIAEEANSLLDKGKAKIEEETNEKISFGNREYNLPKTDMDL